jgi:hypothetical protein
MANLISKIIVDDILVARHPEPGSYRVVSGAISILDSRKKRPIIKRLPASALSMLY